MDDHSQAAGALRAARCATAESRRVLGGAVPGILAQQPPPADAPPTATGPAAATSPTAYLAALLGYATRNLRSGQGTVSEADLKGWLYQDFAALSAPSAVGTQSLPQVRICAEVLRQFLADDTAAQDYLDTAYELLLNALGSSLSEVRTARVAADRDRARLAARLGIDLDAQRPDQLDQLYLSGTGLTEAALAEYFGLPSSVPGDPMPAVPQVQAWQQAHLRVFWLATDWPGTDPPGAAPLVDPDLIPRACAVAPAALALWDARTALIAGQRAALQALISEPGTAQQQFDAIAQAATGNPDAGQDLARLAAQQDKGTNISKSLAAAGLTQAGFTRLATLAAALDPPLSLSLQPDEWDDIVDIYLQSWKIGRYPDWRADEKRAGLTLSPDFFAAASGVGASLPPWRADPDVLQDWLATLRSRTGQDTDVVQGVAAAVQWAEQATRPMLRDALLARVAPKPATPGPATPAVVAEWAGDRLLIDTTVAGTQQTQRTAQAIETLQDLLWGVRTGQLTQPTFAGLKLGADDFDTEWAWLSSYGAWAASQSVTLYPENFIQPSPRAWQTPAFGDLAAAGPATPDAVRELAGGYLDYLRDVASLEIRTSCLAETAVAPDPAQPVPLSYTFAAGGQSGAVYWSARDPQSPSADTPWTRVPGLDPGYEVLAAVPVAVSATQRYLALVVTIDDHGTRSVAVTRYDLATSSWDNGPTALSAPPAAEYVAVVEESVVIDVAVPALPPAVVVMYDSGETTTLRRGRLNSSLTGLDADGWAAVSDAPKSMANLYASVTGPNQESWLVTADQDGSMVITGSNLPASGVPVSTANFLAVVYAPGITGYVLYNQASVLGHAGQDTQWLPLEGGPGGTLAGAGSAESVGRRRGDPFSVDNPAAPLQWSTAEGIFQATLTIDTDKPALTLGAAERLAPTFASAPWTLAASLTQPQLTARAAKVVACAHDNAGAGLAVLEYLREAFFYVPLQFAGVLADGGQFLPALDWYRTVYDYTQDAATAIQVTTALWPADGPVPAWLADPHDAHLTAAIQPDAIQRFVLFRLAGLFQAYADAEFGADTGESVSRARTLYLTSQSVLARVPRGDADDPSGTDAFVLANGFAVPPNPVLRSLVTHAANSLYKIRAGRNIAGMVRPLDPYGAGDVAVQLLPSRYRYKELIARAKELAQLASQMEGSLLAALEQRDAQQYTLRKAQQDLGVANAQVQAQRARLQQAQDATEAAALAKQRAQEQVRYYTANLASPVSELEQQSLDAMRASISYQKAAAITNYVAAALPASISYGFPSGVSVGVSPQASVQSVASGLSAEAGADSTEASMAAAQASYQRRAEDWQQALSAAQVDVRTGDVQITEAADGVQVAGSDTAVAQLQADNAASNVQYLANQFTNAALFAWMSRILTQTYRFFLQQATAMARVAVTELAFERQQPVPVVLQPDYWRAPDASGAGAPSSADNLGLTGSARLLTDIYQLDQYAFQTAQQKLQLSRSISLLKYMPEALMQLKVSGVAQIRTPTSLFDQDFPGHYLRLVSRVSVSFVGLVDAKDVVKGTLSSSGVSRVVVPADGAFSTISVTRPAEQIAVTSVSTDGSFSWQPVSDDSPTLRSFEGSGVDSLWQIMLPKPANLFDYGSIQDVVLTLEYTALSDDDLRAQVIRELGSQVSRTRIFSLAGEFQDAWTKLQNPHSSPVTVTLPTGADQYGPNLSHKIISQVAMYFLRPAGSTLEVAVDSLTFTPAGSTSAVGGPAQSNDGIISTQRGNATAWLPIVGAPVSGTWSLGFAAGESFVQDGAVLDILLAVSYDAQLPPWPA